MDLENAYMGRILVVDLNEGTCEEEELTEEMVNEHIGGAAINLALYKQHVDRNPIVFGTGLLTGTFTPSSCAGVMTGKSPVTGRVCHVPLSWQTAVELKYSGYDFVVVLGESDKPVRLWLHDELAELADAKEVWGQDVWKTTDKLRYEHGDDYVQLIGIGPAGEKGCRIAQISEGAWGSRDVFGMGLALGARKLKAIAMRGLGSLEVADGFFDECLEAQQELRKGAIFEKQGLVALLEALGLDAADLEPIQQKVHRHSAAFNCAYAANTYLMIDEPPDLLKESKKDEPGLLLTDPAGVISLLFLKEGLPVVLREINRQGLDPVACGALLKKEEVTEADEAVKRVTGLCRRGDRPGRRGRGKRLRNRSVAPFRVPRGAFDPGRVGLQPCRAPEPVGWGMGGCVCRRRTRRRGPSGGSTEWRSPRFSGSVRSRPSFRPSSPSRRWLSWGQRPWIGMG